MNQEEVSRETTEILTYFHLLLFFLIYIKTTFINFSSKYIDLLQENIIFGQNYIVLLLI